MKSYWLGILYRLWLFTRVQKCVKKVDLAGRSILRLHRPVVTTNDNERTSAKERNRRNVHTRQQQTTTTTIVQQQQQYSDLTQSHSPRCWLYHHQNHVHRRSFIKNHNGDASVVELLPRQSTPPSLPQNRRHGINKACHQDHTSCIRIRPSIMRDSFAAVSFFFVAVFLFRCSFLLTQQTTHEPSQCRPHHR